MPDSPSSPRCHRDVHRARSSDGCSRHRCRLRGRRRHSARERVFDEIAAARAEPSFAVAPADYAELFRTAIADRVVRRPGLPGVRVRIYGVRSRRGCTSVDRVVLGRLVEGAWPPETRTDPWLSRPMRRALGLDLPERRISLSAHDFRAGCSAPTR